MLKSGTVVVSFVLIRSGFGPKCERKHRGKKIDSVPPSWRSGLLNSEKQSDVQVNILLKGGLRVLGR